MAPQDYSELSKLARTQAAKLMQRARRVISREAQAKLVAKAEKAAAEADAYDVLMLFELGRLGGFEFENHREMPRSTGQRLGEGAMLSFDADESSEWDWHRPRKSSLLRGTG